METLVHDVRYGIRVLLKNPGFSLVAVMALALGIGANTAIFSVVNSILLRSLPYPDADRIMSIWTVNPSIEIGFDQFPNSPGMFADYQNQSQIFESVAGYSTQSLNLEGTGLPERIGGTRTSVDLFSVLGVRPLMGRTFLANEDQPGHDNVVVLSHALWQRRFGSDPDILGKSLNLSGRSYTVIGIMPMGFNYPRGAELPPYLQFPDRTDLWTPMGFSPEQLSNRGNFSHAVLAKLKPGVSVAQAQAELTALSKRNQQNYPETDAGFSSVLVPVNEFAVHSLRPALLVLSGAVVFVLLIACANVANLLLARGASRQKEVAIRSALGARRSRMIRQFLTESLILSLAGGALGLLLAFWGTKLLISVTPDNIPRVKDVSIDPRVLLFTFGVAIVTGIIFGLVPALQASKSDFNEVLKDAVRGSTGGRHRARKLLVISEVALALVLLIGAGLMIKSFSRLYAVDPGINTNNVLAVTPSLPELRYPAGDRQRSFYANVIQRIQALPGVLSVGAISEIPLSGAESVEVVSIEGRPPARGLNEMMVTNAHVVNVDYFSAMGIPVLAGRNFGPGDRESAPMVAIVNQTFVRRYFPDEDPLEKRFQMGSGEPWTSIVGVVKDVKHTSLTDSANPEIFRPNLQVADRDLSLLIRTAAEPLTMVSSVRSQIWAEDKDMAISSVTTMKEIISESLSRRRFSLVLMGAFAALALLLAGVGIYGVVSCSVEQRSHEIGIRMALGAQQASVLGLIVRSGMAPVTIGVAAGLAAAVGLTRWMASLLYDVSTTDPTTFATISVVLGLIGLVACIIPARRACRVDPMVALRHE